MDLLELGTAAKIVPPEGRQKATREHEIKRDDSRIADASGVTRREPNPARDQIPNGSAGGPR